MKFLLRVACAFLVAGCASGTPGPAVPTPARLAPEARLIPAPLSIQRIAGQPFTIERTSTIVVDSGNAETLRIGELLGQLLRPATGYALPVTTTSAIKSIALRLGGDPSLGEEGYTIAVGADSLRLAANKPAGLFRGIQTIRQLLPPTIESQIANEIEPWIIPALNISDRPRFVWRGAMFDVARHFFTVREVEQFIDLLAMYKMNGLHLGLSNDQGWRIAINSRPRLTAFGSGNQVGGGRGGFYTQQDYSEIVRYAQARYITVVPEIDMPGHTNAALIGYPALSCSTRPPAPFTGILVGWSTFCADNEQTYALIDDVVREISALTPGPFFHAGGDEVYTLTNEQYARFVERVQGIVTKYGKKMIGWEEITKARLLPTTIVQQWRTDSATAALKYGSKLILSPGKHLYLDMKYTPATELGLKWAGYVEVRDAYDWDPAQYLKGVGETSIFGVEAPIWTETLPNITALEYMLMPRLPAVAELGWTPQANRNWETFRSALASHEPRWRLLGVNYYRSPQVPWNY